jgi:type I restriction enzyme S subunit
VKTPLAEVLAVHYGKALKESERVDSGSRPVFGSNGIVGQHDRSLVDEATIVIGRKGSAGAITYAPEGGWPIDTTFYVEVLDKRRLDLRYLFWALREAKLDRHTITTSIPGLNRDRILGTKIPLPPLAEQRRIAAILDRAHAVRRKRKESTRLADELLRSAFLEMFGDPVANPKRWPERQIGDIAFVTTGNTPSRQRPEYYGEAVEWIKSDNINTPEHIVTRAEEGLSADGIRVGRIAEAGSTLMTCIAGSPACVGNVALTDRRVAFNQQINALTPGEFLDAAFLYTELLLSKPLIRRASTDSMKGMVTKGRLCSLRVPLPPRDQQNRFGQWFTRFLGWRRRLSDTACRADDLSASLSTEAFRPASTEQST